MIYRPTTTHATTQTLADALNTEAGNSAYLASLLGPDSELGRDYAAKAEYLANAAERTLARQTAPTERISHA